MSHFSVIVVTDEYPTEDVLTKQLQPFHEFECTGIDDEFVQDIDVTDECRQNYDKYTYTRLRDEQGNLHDYYDAKFYREPTPAEIKQHGAFLGSGGSGSLSWRSDDWGDGRGYRTKIHFTPAGMQEIEVPASEVESLAAFAEGYYGHKPTTAPDITGEHKYGYCLLDESGNVIKIIDRTNKNKKWDYWRVGGRYTGKLWPKAGKIDKAKLSWEWKDASGGHEPPGGADICQKGNLDVARMKQCAVQKRRAWIEEIMEKAKIASGEMDAAIEQHRTAHARWLELTEPRPRGNEYSAWLLTNGYQLADKLRAGTFMEVPDVQVGQTVEQWIEASPYLTAFAFLRNNKWAEQGEMGWWACVSNENEYWPALFQRLIDEVPNDKWLTVVDCHI